MTKYNQTFKQQVVNFYFEHHKNLSLTLRYFNLSDRTVSRWVAQYKYSGVHGLAALHSERIYAPEFKLKVVKSILTGRFSPE
ncbi:transposase and inactivated derivative, partial [Actinobacillus minor 202]